MSARQRWKTTSVPEMALFFKAIEPAQLADPGAQLAKVLEFRKSITEGKEFLYKEFATPAQLADFMDGVFAEYAKSQRNSESSQATTSSEQRASQSPAAGEDEISIDDGSIEKVLSVAHAAELGTSSKQLDFWGRLRLWLHATALFGESRPHLAIGVHEANLVYRVRSWALSAAERWALVDSMLSESSHYIPGWVWLSERGLDATRSRLWDFCLAGGESRKGAAALLAVDDKIIGTSAQVRSLLADEVVSPHLCRLLERCGTMEHLSLLEEVGASADEVRKRVFAKAEFEITRRCGPEITLEVAYGYVNAGVKDALSVLVPKLLAANAEVSPSALSLISNERFRAAAAEEILSAKRMSISSASDLLKDPGQTVRAVAVKALVGFGWTFSRTQIADLFPENSRGGLLSRFMSGVDVDELAVAGKRNLTVDQLQPMVEFFSTDGRSAFHVLAFDHWDHYANEVAKQLDEEFEPLLQRAEQKALSDGYSAIAVWSQGETDLIEFVRGSFLRSALEAVARHGHPKATTWVQRYSAPEHPVAVRVGALRLQLSLGATPDYSAVLLNLGDFPAELVEQLIPELLTSLDPDPKVVEAIAKVANVAGREVLRRSLAGSVNEPWHEVLSECLNSGTDKARQVAALVLCDIKSEAELLTILDSYVSQATYFYDVVAIFDWHVFGLEPYRSAIGAVTSFG